MGQYSVNNRSVETLLSEIRSGTMVVPEIQRPFVWTPTKVRDLMDSLYKGYPIGYIVVWRSPSAKLKDGTPSLAGQIIIDGQQRITALESAIIGRTVINKDYEKKRIKISFNPQTEEFETNNPAISKDTKWIQDMKDVMDSSFSSYDFVTEYCVKNNIHGKEQSISSAVTKLAAIKNSSIGIIELSAELDINTVAVIFQRINSAGAKLSQADFVMSKISATEAYGGDVIWKTIDYFCHLAKYPSDFAKIQSSYGAFANEGEASAIAWAKNGVGNVYIPDYKDCLRVAFTATFCRGKFTDLVELLSGRDFKTREYKDAISQDAFGKLRSGVLAFVNKTNFQNYVMILTSAGLVDGSLTKAQGALNFGYALYLLLHNKKVNPAIVEKAVRQWVILSMLTDRYSSGSVETIFGSDIASFANPADPLSIIDNTESGVLSDAYWNNLIIDKLTTASVNSPIFGIYRMAQAQDGSRGFLSEKVTVKSMIENHGDIHHLFPKKYLIDCGINDKAQYNQIANYALVQSEINNQIKDRAPAEYMADVIAQCNGGQIVYGGIANMTDLDNNRRANCIPDGFENMDYRDYDAFLAARRLLMASKIKTFYYGLKS